MTIRRQLVLLVMACVVPAVAAGALLIGYSYQRQRIIIEQTTLDTARALTQAVDQELTIGLAALHVLATSPYLVSGDLAAFHQQARDVLQRQPGNGIVLADASGQQVMSTIFPYGTPLPRSGIPDVVRRIVETGNAVATDFYIGATSKRPQVAVGVPVFRDGNVAYALTMALLPERLGEILMRQHLPAGWVVSIFDSKGTVVARTHEADRYIGHKGAPALVQRMAKISEGRVETDTLEGIPVVAIFSRSAVSGWSVAIGIPRAALARSLWTPISLLIGAALVLLGAGIALAHRLGSSIAGSIRGLIPPAMALSRREPVAVPLLGLREADEVARSLERTARLLRDREEILAVVSHDMRNPLGALMMAASSAERLAAQLPGGEPMRDLAALLVDISHRLSGMVDDLLAVAVSTSGGRSLLKIAPEDASSLVERASAAARALFAREGVALQTETSGALPVIDVDADRILRVFANLLDNALKFTKPSGDVVLRAEARPGAVQFSVANSGPALSTEELQSMFRPFWQARPQDQRGAGLGLSICRSIIETHGGSIWAEPEPGKRVRICFLLPASTAAGPDSLESLH